MRSSRRIDNALLAVYAKCGELSLAEKLFEEINERDIVSWNALISGYCQRGENGKAHMLFNLMRDEGIEPCLITWNILKLIEYYYPKIYGSDAQEYIKEVSDGIKELFNENSIGSTSISVDHGVGSSANGVSSESWDHLKDFDMFLKDTSHGQNTVSDLEKYLEEPVFPRSQDFKIFDLLPWV